MRKSIYVAKVLNNEDPQRIGAVKIQANDLIDDAALSEELTPGRYPFAGGGEGFYYAPQKGSLLEIEINEDEEESTEDINSRWTGMLYTKDDDIPEEFQSDPLKRGGIKFGDEVFLQDKTLNLSSLISENVRLGEEAASHPLNRGDTYNEQLVLFLDALTAYITAIQAIADPAGTATNALKAAIAAFKLAKETWLSTKCKTE